MSGLGGQNKSDNGVVIGLVQLQLPRVVTPADLAAGAYRVPWEDTVRTTDGTTCGFPAPTRVFGQTTQEAAE